MNGTIQGTRANQSEKLTAYPPTPGSNSSANTKALGSSSETQLATWYEEAFAYYNAVQSGQETQPDPASWNEFLNQMRWAYDQLMGTPAWDPLPTSGSFPTNGQTESQPDPFGAQIGTGGRLIHTEEKCRVGFIGDDKRDIWSNEIDIDVAPLSANVQATRTMDESLDPPEEVLKILVTDPATGTQAVYLIHDYEDAQIRINVPNTEGQVQDFSGLEPSPIEVGEFKGMPEPTVQEASIEGEPHEEHENYRIYEGRIGQSIEFYPESNGDEAPTEYHEVYGDSVVYTRPSDHVSVLEGIHEMGFDQEEGYTVVVTHRDGTQDVYYIHKGFDVQLGAQAEYVSWNGGEEGSETSIPEAFKEHVSFLETVKGTATSPSTPDSGNSAADEVDGDRAYYNTQEDITLQNDFEGEIKTHHITTSGTVEINAENFGDKATITVLPNGNFLIEMTNEAGEEIKYVLEGPPSQVFLNGFLPSKVVVYRAEDPNGNSRTHIYSFNSGATGLANEEDLEKINGIIVTAGNAKNPSEVQETFQQENFPEALQKLMDLTGKGEEQILQALNSAYISDYDSIEELVSAMKDNNGQFPLNIPQDLSRVINFLFILDPEFNSTLSGATVWDGTDLTLAYNKAAARLAQLLQTLYPNENISKTREVSNRAHWRRANEITINGVSYDFSNQSKGHTHQIDVKESRD